MWHFLGESEKMQASEYNDCRWQVNRLTALISGDFFQPARVFGISCSACPNAVSPPIGAVSLTVNPALTHPAAGVYYPPRFSQLPRFTKRLESIRSA